MFSMSFFNFNPSEGTPQISGWIGLYIGLTVLCTILIFVSWKEYTKRTGTGDRAAREPDIEKGSASQAWDSNASSPQTAIPAYPR